MKLITTYGLSVPETVFDPKDEDVYLDLGTETEREETGLLCNNVERLIKGKSSPLNEPLIPVSR